MASTDPPVGRPHGAAEAASALSDTDPGRTADMAAPGEAVSAARDAAAPSHVLAGDEDGVDATALRDAMATLQAVAAETPVHAAAPTGAQTAIQTAAAAAVTAMARGADQQHALEDAFRRQQAHEDAFERDDHDRRSALEAQRAHERDLASGGGDDDGNDGNDDIFGDDSNDGDDGDHHRNVTFEDRPAEDDGHGRSDNDAAPQDAMPEGVEYMDPNDPLMASIQAKLASQLQASKAKLLAELRDRREGEAKAVARREQIGVDLYGAQQRLVGIQARVQTSQETYMALREQREQEEAKVTAQTTQLQEAQRLRDKQATNLQEHKTEMERVRHQLRQAELYRDEMRSKIQITKRMANKGEAQLLQQEMEKRRQDFYIEQLVATLRQLQEDKAFYEAQYRAQAKETEQAVAVLQEASTEIEAVQFEKRQILQQWKSSLNVLTQKDQVLSQIEAGIKDASERRIGFDREYDSFQKSLRNVQEELERQMSLKRQVEGEVTQWRERIQQSEAERDTLLEQYALVDKTLKLTEADLAKMTSAYQKGQRDARNVSQQLQRLHNANKILQEQLTAGLQEQTSLSKAAQAAKAEHQKLEALNRDKELAVAQLENDMAKARVKLYTLQATSDEVRTLLEESENEIQKKTRQLEEFVQRQNDNNDELKKKLAQADVLNRKYEQLKSNNLDENVGPLEAMIHSLSHSIEAKVKENGELQQSWLRLQEELLSLTKRASELRDENQDTRLKINLLTRKRIQIDQTFSKEEALTRSLKKSLNALHTEMTRLNTLIHTEGKHGEAVRESTLNLQQEFRGKLQDAERASIQLEQRIADLQAEKERTLSDLLYAERQILLWEKKIQLAKETQAALDPDVGAAEMKEMKAEIYRMQLKHASLLKLQQKMVADMERNITRHETITSRSINQQQRSDAKSQAQSSLRRAIDEMGKKLRQTLSDVDEVEGQLNTVRAAVMEMEEQLQATERAFAELGEAAEASRRAIADRQLLRRLCMHGTLIHQRQARRYNEFALQKYVPLFRDAEKRSLERGVVGQRVQEVCALLTEVDQQYGSSFQVTLAPLHAFAAEHLTTKSK